ncbi:MAG TPA: aldo/keto reductase [Caldilineaceae bacterium]|mgnify:FL=1|nr:aldo/keto reductase [Caldilineaceae bacterium]
MQTRQLGKDGPQIPVLGLGAWPLGGGMGTLADQAVIDITRAAIDSGITLVDTAQYYRTSEATLGKALKDGYRQRCFLATKVSFDFTRTGIRAAMENSLRQLQVDDVDLYQIHSWNPSVPIEESMETMAQLQQEGKTRYIGVSNFNAAQMERALQTAFFHSNQPRYHLLAREIEREDLPFCAQHGIGILAHSPLAKGILTGKYKPGHQFPPDDERSRDPRFQGEGFARGLAVAERLKQVADDKGISMVQMAIAWLLRLPAITCVLVGAKSTAQVQEHLGAAEITFSGEELARIEEILAGAAER